MENVRTYIIFGPDAALRRMIDQLFEQLEPSYNFIHDSTDHNDTIHMAVYEEYEQQINASVTLTFMAIYSGNNLQINLVKTGGRVGFRGSSLTDKRRTIDDDVIEFINDFGKRHGLTVQKQTQEKSTDSDNEQ